jgi:fluoride exporter
MWTKVLNLVIGGTAGTIARYALAGFVYRIMGTDFPYGTMIVNLSGCFLIGFLASISENKFMLDPNTRVLLMIGFCGAYTTFSTLIFESNNLLKDGEMVRAFLNILVSVIVGLIVFRFGSLLGERI